MTLSRSDAARVAALSRWSRTDTKAGTQAARAAFADKFERMVDPAGDLDPAERSKRASRARRAHMLRLAAKSAEARRNPGVA
jgi:hypothetical protein